VRPVARLRRRRGARVLTFNYRLVEVVDVEPCSGSKRLLRDPAG
jgi:hypothetical protein